MWTNWITVKTDHRWIVSQIDWIRMISDTFCKEKSSKYHCLSMFICGYFLSHYNIVMVYSSWRMEESRTYRQQVTRPAAVIDRAPSCVSDLKGIPCYLWLYLCINVLTRALNERKYNREHWKRSPEYIFRIEKYVPDQWKKTKNNIDKYAFWFSSTRTNEVFHVVHAHVDCYNEVISALKF